MLIVCPGCKTRFSFDEQKVGAEGVKLRCTKCYAIFRVMRKAPLPVPPPAVPEPAAVAPPPAVAPSAPPRLKVLVANESEAFCVAVNKVLSSEPFDVFTYNDGKAAYAASHHYEPLRLAHGRIPAPVTTEARTAAANIAMNAG